MSTFSQVYIKTKNLNKVLHNLESAFPLGRREILDDSKWWFYSENNNDTIIVSQNYNIEWIGIEFPFTSSVYMYDTFLKQLSNIFHTIALLGFYQSTTGNGRIVRFEEGEIKYSLSQTSLDKDRLILSEKIGITEEFKQKLNITGITKIGNDFCLIDVDFIYKFFEINSLKSDNHVKYEDWKFLHIEKLNNWETKNLEWHWNSNNLIDINLVKKLQELAIKSNIADLKLICKDVDGKILFLEIGNSNAGLTHIMKRHWNPKELIKYFNSQDEMIEKIFNNLKNEKYITKEIVVRNGRESFEYTCKMNVIGGEKLFRFGIGSNGFIVTFYPQ